MPNNDTHNTSKTSMQLTGSRYWQSLTKPTAPLKTNFDQRRAKSLLSLSLIIAALIFVFVPFWALVGRQTEIMREVFPALFISVLVVYGIAHTRYYYVGIYVLIAILIIAISTIAIHLTDDPPRRVLILTYLATPILIAATLLPPRFVSVVMLLCMGIIGLLLAVWQLPPQTGLYLYIFMVFVAAVSIAIKITYDGYIHRLELSEARYRTLFEQSHDAVFLLDLQGNHIIANRRAAAMFGYTHEEIQHLSLRDLSAEVDASENTRERLIQGEIIPSYERMFRRKDGTLIPVEINAELVRCGENQPLYIQSVVRDISQRKASEQALINSEMRYRSIVTAITEGIILLDSEGTILACNDAAEKILGLTKDQIIGRTPADPRWRAIYEDGSPFPTEKHPAVTTLHTGIPQYNVVMGVHKPTGELKWISINSQPLIHQDETKPYAVVTSFTDVTEHKLLEETIRQSQEQTFKLAIERERVRVMTNFMTDASHEFRTPLTIINTSLHLMSKLTDLEKREAQVSKVQAQTQRITRLIDMLLAMVKLDGGAALHIELTYLDILLKELIDYLHPDITKKNHKVILQAAHLSPIYGDPDQLFTALRCLVENAIRYTPVNGQIIIRVIPQDETVIIEIEDNGMGIQPHTLKLIFERFWREDTAHTTPGLGLGLPLAQKIIELHGGSINVVSKVNHGTTFSVTLPISQAEKTIPHIPSSEAT